MKFVAAGGGLKIPCAKCVLDQLHSHCAAIEAALVERERSLFKLGREIP
jgi:hypothetical protein